MTMRVAFLGMGKMGRAMASHIPAAGHELTVWNRTPAKAEDVGAPAANTPAEATAHADLVILALTDAAAVESILFGPSGVLTAARPSTLIIDVSTIGPHASRNFAGRLKGHHLRYLDAPVCGSVGRAVRGTLTTFAGGTTAEISEAMPLLRLWSADVQHVGPIGSGSAAKLVRNLTLGLALAAVGEALRLAGQLELPQDVAFAALAAGPLADLIPKLRNLADPAPADFTIDLLAKDLALCLAQSELPMAREAWRTTDQISKAGHGDRHSHLLALNDWS